MGRHSKKFQMQVEPCEIPLVEDAACGAWACERPFGYAQGREPVERQLDFLRSRQASVYHFCEVPHGKEYGNGKEAHHGCEANRQQRTDGL